MSPILGENEEYYRNARSTVQKLYKKSTDAVSENSALQLFAGYYRLNKEFFRQTAIIHKKQQDTCEETQKAFKDLWVRILVFRAKLLKNFSLNQGLIKELDKEMNFFVNDTEGLSKNSITYLTENIRRQFFISLLQGNPDEAADTLKQHEDFLNKNSFIDDIAYEQELMNDTNELINGKVDYFELLKERTDKDEKYLETLDFVWERFVRRPNAKMTDLNKEKERYAGNIGITTDITHMIQGEIFYKNKDVWIIPVNTDMQIKIDDLYGQDEEFFEELQEKMKKRAWNHNKYNNEFKPEEKFIRSSLNHKKNGIVIYSKDYLVNDEFFITYLYTLMRDKNYRIEKDDLDYVAYIMNKLTSKIKLRPIQNAEMHNYLSMVLDKYLTQHNDEESKKVVEKLFQNGETKYQNIILKNSILGDFYSDLTDTKNRFHEKIKNISKKYIRSLTTETKTIKNELHVLGFVKKELLHQVQLKDLVTYKHVIRMKDISDDILNKNNELKKIIFQEIRNYIELPLTNDEINIIIEICIHLHDIGKLYIPDFIQDSNHKTLWNFIRDSHKRHNQDALIRTMNTHAEKGGKILRDLKPHFPNKILDLVVAVAEDHHSDPEIVSTFRSSIKNIISFVKIVDTLEACTADRPYREKAFTTEEGIKLVKHNRHYDQKIVEEMLSVSNIENIITLKTEQDS